MKRLLLALSLLFPFLLPSCGSVPRQVEPDEGGLQISAADSSRGNRRRRAARTERRAARVAKSDSNQSDEGGGGSEDSGSGGSEDSGSGGSSDSGSGDSSSGGSGDSGGGFGSAFASASQSGSNLNVTVTNVDSEDAQLIFTTSSGVDMELVPAGSTADITFPIPASDNPLTQFSAVLDLRMSTGTSLETLDVDLIEPVNLGSAPLLSLTAAQLQAIKDLKNSNSGYSSMLRSKITRASNGYISDNLAIPQQGGAWVELYNCPDHGTQLTYISDSKHKCSKDGTFFAGTDATAVSSVTYSDVIATHKHWRLAEEVYVLALSYLINGTAAHGERARDIILGYGALYPELILHDRFGGTGSSSRPAAGYIMCQTLDEAEWMIDFASGYDLLRGSDLFTEENQTMLATNLFKPAADLFVKDSKGIHNIQCYLNTGAFFGYLIAGEPALARARIHANDGLLQQLSQGVQSDGMWIENSFGYHFYMLRGSLPMARAMKNLGMTEDVSVLRTMFTGPYSLTSPDGTLPMLNDGSLSRLSPAGSDGEGVYRGSIFEEAVGLFDGDATIAAPLAKWDRSPDFKALIYGQYDLPSGASAGDQADANLPAMGAAIIRVGSSANQSTVLLDFGPHGGHHGHPDKLGITTWLNGRKAIGEAGSIGYGTTLYKGYYKRTLAHSTVLVDGEDHEEVGGTLDVFDSSGKRLVASCDTAADGVDLTRMVHLTPEGYMLDLYKAGSESSHFYDYVIHSYGDAGSLTTSLSLTSTTSAGVNSTPYQALSNMKTATTNDDFEVTVSDDSGSHTIRFFGSPGTLVLVAESPWYPAGTTSPVVIVRRTGENAVFAMATANGSTFPADLNVSVNETDPSLTYTSGGQPTPTTLNFDE
jgi:hypothetical protein